jgi:hypothetical protein
VYSSSVANAFNVIVATPACCTGPSTRSAPSPNTWYYRSQLRSGGRNLISVGLLALAAAGFLVWVIVKSVAGFSRGENFTLAGVLVTGIAVLVFAQVVKRSPFFKLQPVRYEMSDPPRND